MTRNIIQLQANRIIALEQENEKLTAKIAEQTLYADKLRELLVEAIKLMELHNIADDWLLRSGVKQLLKGGE